MPTKVATGKRRTRWWTRSVAAPLVVSSLFMPACGGGGGGGAPGSTPTGTGRSIPEVSGAWTGTIKRSSITGSAGTGGCATRALRAQPRVDDEAVAITQQASLLTVTVEQSAGSMERCEYEGTIDEDGNLTLTGPSPECFYYLGVTCSNGEGYVFLPVGYFESTYDEAHRYEGRLAGDRLRGTATFDWIAYGLAGPNTFKVVGGMTVEYRFDWSRGD